MLMTGIFSYLSTYPGLVALISTRIYPTVLPQQPTLPAVVFQQISGAADYSQGGHSGLSTPRVQFKCWADDPLEAATVAEQVKAALSGYKDQMGDEQIGACFLELERWDYDAEIDPPLHWYLLDFVFWHEQSA